MNTLSSTVPTVLTRKFVAGLLLAIVVLSVSYYILNRSTVLIDQPAIILGHELRTIDDCISVALKQERQEQEKLPNKKILASSPYASFSEKIHSLSETCYDRIRWQGLLNDFQIRRAKFAIQYESEKIILWMVVVLTLSGVMLAALQLAATFHLARTGQSNDLGKSHEVTIEQGKIVLRSSVTGLFILIFSFAFFYVYIYKVFTITELQMTESPSVSEYDKSSDGINGKPTLEVEGSLTPPQDKTQVPDKPVTEPSINIKTPKRKP